MPTSADYCSGWAQPTYDAKNRIVWQPVYKMVNENVTCIEINDNQPRGGYIIAMNATNGKVESTIVACDFYDCPLSIQYWAGI